MSMPQPIPHTIPATPLFSWELMQGYGSPEPGKRFSYAGFTTPFGTFAGPVALCGTLTEIKASGTSVQSLRVSDPTGICMVNTDERNAALQSSVADLEAPCFLYLLGKLRVSSQPQQIPVIYAESVVPIAKETRNSWICAAASYALDRLESVPDSDFKTEFKEHIAAALEAVVPSAPQVSAASSALSDEDILDLISSLYEGKSAVKAKVLDALAAKGLTPAEASARISELMENGDIYAPKPDILKVL